MFPCVTTELEIEMLPDGHLDFFFVFKVERWLFPNVYLKQTLKLIRYMQFSMQLSMRQDVLPNIL